MLTIDLLLWFKHLEKTNDMLPKWTDHVTSVHTKDNFVHDKLIIKILSWNALIGFRLVSV